MKLEPPVKRYLMGKLPTHSSTVNLADNFKGLDKSILLIGLSQNGYVDDNFKIQRKALDDGLVDVCERNALWNLEKVEEFLTNNSLNVERVYVNQELNIKSNGSPQFVYLNVIATYFNVSSQEVGKWLIELGLREKTKNGIVTTKDAIDRGFAMMAEMNANTSGKKKRSTTLWELQLTIDVLMEAGHPLDFSYDTLLEGRGKNSDVSVSSVDAKAKEFAKEFSDMFKDPVTRPKTVHLVSRTPKFIIMKAEGILKKPGFISNNEYRKYIR